MREGMKKYRLAFASGIVEIEVKVEHFPDRKALAKAIAKAKQPYATQLIACVVVERVRRATRRERQWINLGLVERIL